MKEIIKKIFYDNQFEEQELSLSSNNEIFFAVNFNKDCLNFYLVVFIEENFIDSLDLQISEYYNAIKGLKHGYDERMDKNLSMLVCLQDENILPKDKFVKKIFEIEENPYFFKKYVFSYTETQLMCISDYFKKNKNVHSNVLLNNVVNNSDLFVSFKKQPTEDANSLYNLSSKLLIKLPFVVFERGEKEIENLSEKIKEILCEEELINYSNKFLELEEKNEGYNIDDIIEIILEGEKNEL